MTFVSNIYPLAPLQRGLWFTALTDPESRVYHQQLRIGLRGPLDVQSLRRAFSGLIERHDVLRTALAWDDLDEPLQLVFDRAELPLREVDLRDSPAPDALERLAREEYDRAFDLRIAPLMRVCLARVTDSAWECIWTHHHVVLDGWSVGILLQEWRALYRGDSLPTPPPFAAFVAWLAAQDRTRAREHFRALLSDFSEPTPLPRLGATTRGAAESGHAERRSWLSIDDTRRIEARARALETTPSALFVGAFGLLLARHAGRDETLIGVTLSGRPVELAGISEMVGVFINTLPVRVGASAEANVSSFLRDLRVQLSQLQDYQYYSVAEIKNASALANAPHLFEAIVVVENYPIAAGMTEPLGALEVSIDESSAEAGRNHHPLSLIVAFEAGRSELTLSYAKSRFAQREIDALLSQLSSVVCGLAACAPASTLAAIATPEPAERARLLALGRGPTSAVPDERVDRLVARHAQQTPDAPAVVSESGTLSYRELDAHANRLSRYLVAAGLRAGDVLTLALPRSSEFVVAMLAAFKAGAAYLPLELSQPMARMCELIADSGSKLVLSLDLALVELGERGVRVVRWKDVRDEIASLTADTPPPLPPFAADAYLIYTSGSTGKPKAVVVPHSAIVSYTMSALSALEIGRPQRFAWLSTVAADLGHTQLFGALIGGGTLCLIDERTAFDPISLAERLLQLDVDVLKITPGHLRGLLDAHESAALLPKRKLIFGGEVLDGSLAARVRRLAPHLHVFNHYGPTETAVGAVCWRVPDEPFEADVPLGHPLANRHLYVLDSSGSLVPEGVVGQLYIGGDAIAREYLDRPELTRERFVPDPFRGEGRMYATGDRVRWLNGGVLSFVGRDDAQVKIRGHRIELGEVEAALVRVCPHVREVWARAVPVANGGLRLCAYYVANTALSPEKLRDDLSLSVPDAMIPSSFVALDALPRTANGKRDWARLPAAESDPRPRDVVAPRDDLERKLHAIWCAVLQHAAVSVRDSFFALGGDSILSLQIIARSRQQGFAITPKQLFEHKTIERLARALGSDAARDDLPAAAALEPERVPLTAAQRARSAAGAGASWRLVQLDCSSPDVLRPALAAVVEAHAALRARFDLDCDPPSQWLSDPGPTPLQQLKLALADERALAEQAKHAEPFAAWRCEDIAGGEPALLLAAHPLCLDDAGWRAVLADLTQAVLDVEAGRTPQLLASGTDSFAYAKFQASWSRRDDIDAAWQYWLDQPAELQQPRELREPDTRASIGLSIAATSDLLAICRRVHAPPFAAVAAVLGELESRACASRSIVLDVPAGRHELAPSEHQTGEPFCHLPGLVGALTHHAPLFFEPTSEGLSAAAIAAVASALSQRAPRLREYGALRYVSDNDYLRESLLALPRARIALTWLGALDGVLAWGPSERSTEHALHVRAYLRDERLYLACDGPLAADWSAAIERELIGLARSDASQVVPAEHAFPLCAALEYDVRRAPLDWSRIEDVYPLSAMQHGMLLHTLLAPYSGIYLMQQHYTWKGPLDREALDGAWHALLAQHAVLRTAFHWQDDTAPVQCVFRDVDAAVEWRDLQRAADPRAELEDVLREELARGYDLRRAPLTRLRVFRLAAGEYVIVRSFHHILMDAWCFGLVMEELLARYRANLHGQKFFRVAPRPFRDYIAWLAAQDTAAAERFYRTQLAGLSQLAALPGAPRPKRPIDGDSAVDYVDATLTVELSNALEDACRAHNLTPNTWVQGAWALLLARHARSQDVVFGVTTSGRPAELSGVEAMLGLFINSLPLRVALDDSTLLQDWLRQLLAQNLELRRYEHAPLVEIARYAGRPGVPMFETLVVFENAPLGAAQTNAFGVQLDFAEDRVHTNYPITLVVYPGQPLGLRLSYDVARYDRAQLLALQEQLLQLLAQMVQTPHAALGSFTLSGAAQLEQLRAWNQTEVAFPLDRTYAALIEERVAQSPLQIVARCEAEAWTYAELWQRSGLIAGELAARGVTKDSIVVVFAERSLPLLAMVVGVLRARGAFLALELSQPEQRLAEIVLSSGASHAVVASRSLEGWQRVAARTPDALAVVVSDGSRGTDRIHALPSGAPDDLAYVVFTSGSTGAPKGVLIEQRGMLNNMFGKLPLLGIDANDRIAQTASCAFDISVWQLLAAPLLGACVEIFPDYITHDPVRLRAALAAERITIVELVPAVMKAMLAGANATELPALRWLLTTGEAASASVCRAWRARYPQARLLNAYGPAECSDDVSMYEIQPEDALDASVMIGRPTPNNQLYVVDSALRPLPPFALGEIAVGGAGVGRGYLGDPAQTRRVFVELPWLDGARVYLTGDLGRFRDDGVLEFVGRKDEQVKIRGHRIELREIETRLASIEGVRDAAVVCVDDARGEAFLVAYCEVANGAEVARDRLRARLAEQLPHYMVPNTFTCLPALPRNDNGKVDRNALRALGVPPADRERRVAPRDAGESALHEIWCDVLACEDVGVFDNFFEVGGHSLLATQVMSRIQARFGVALPLRAFFAYPTIAELASAVGREPRRVDDAGPITAQDHEGMLPLSFAQQRLWFLEQLHAGSTAFNLGFALRVSGALDVCALRNAFTHVIARHEILRTAFLKVQGEPRQVIEPRVAFGLAVEESSGDPRAELSELVSRPLDLAHAPLLRARLLRTGEDEHALLLVVHHIVVDAWSLGLLVEELSQAYCAFHAGARPEPAPLALSYADYAIWQRRPELAQTWRASLEYFREELRDCPSRLELRGACEIRETERNGRAERVRLRGDAGLRENLARAAQRHDVTVFMLLHTALTIVIRQQSGSTDFLIGTDVANRSRLLTERMIGFFVNQLVLRSRVRDDSPFATLIAQSRATILAALEHQELPFDRLVAELLPERDRRAMPFFQVKLILQNTAERVLRLPGLQIEELEAQAPDAELDLLISVQEQRDGLEIALDYRQARFERAHVERLGALLLTAIQVLCEPSARTVRELVSQLEQTEALHQQTSLDRARSDRERQRQQLSAARVRRTKVDLPS